jgi:hypothetical protein
MDTFDFPMAQNMYAIFRNFWQKPVEIPNVRTKIADPPSPYCVRILWTLPNDDFLMFFSVTVNQNAKEQSCFFFQYV